jgi:hypothetical protein
MREPIFTAEFVEAMGAEWAAELLTRCYYDILDLELRIIEPPVLLLRGTIHRGLRVPRLVVRCECGGQMGTHSMTCLVCFRKTLAARSIVEAA